MLDSAAYRRGEVAVFVWYDESAPVPNLWIAPTAAPGARAGVGRRPPARSARGRTMLGVPCLADACARRRTCGPPRTPSRSRRAAPACDPDHGAATAIPGVERGRDIALQFTAGRPVDARHVDSEKCQGHNRCYAIAPELFDVDDLGYAHELNDGDVPAELEDKARLAVANCPEYAIAITE